MGSLLRSNRFAASIECVRCFHQPGSLVPSPGSTRSIDGVRMPGALRTTGAPPRVMNQAAGFTSPALGILVGSRGTSGPSTNKYDPTRLQTRPHPQTSAMLPANAASTDSVRRCHHPADKPYCSTGLPWCSVRPLADTKARDSIHHATPPRAPTGPRHKCKSPP